MRIVRIVALVGLVGLGCNKTEEPPRNAAAPTEGLELVTAGLHPRRVLRYQLAKGTATRVTLAIDVDLDAGAEGGALPTMEIETEISCQDVLPDGSMKVRTTIVHVTAKDRPGGVIPAGQMATSQLDGMTLSGVLAPNGTLKDMQLDLTGKELPPALHQQLMTLSRSFEQVAMPLPPEPVGIGAQWKHRKTLAQSGMTMLMVTTITVTAITGDKVGFMSTSGVTGKDQTMTQGGMEIALKNLGGQGSGYGTVDLARMVMNGELSGDFHSDMSAQGQDATMKMRIVTRMTPGAPPPAVPDADQGAQSAP